MTTNKTTKGKKKLSGGALAFAEFNRKTTAELKEKKPNQSATDRREEMLRLWRKDKTNPNRGK
ncbi:hypothetical protein BCR35DRAFT_332181 [Leucosporidium creatinivorum]|uniref:Uncharacterized protein n=1 Tax=Leucosporidium creatinivorum TaxID=106004 RepID=A0A1Y2F4K5_9BASI|nr:hypothetical protein BCR35DRAFT_332181 [Leucosporidium creatinivorum]